MPILTDMAAAGGARDALGSAKSELDEFKALVTAKSVDEKAAKAKLVQLKIIMTEMPSLPPAVTSGSATAIDEQTVARDILEHAFLLSVLTSDDKGLERHYAYLQPYYSELRGNLPESKQRLKVVGLLLMFLLVKSRLGEFHLELERLSDEDLAAAEIAFPVKLESRLLEGSYNYVLGAREGAPNKLFQPFLDGIVQTVRDEVAECMSASYEKISAEGARKMLHLGTGASADAELGQIVEDQGWTMEDGWVKFAADEERVEGVEAIAVVQSTLEVATEMERII